jgi:hypothetical protein
MAVWCQWWVEENERDWTLTIPLSVASGAVRPFKKATSKKEGTGIRNAGWRIPSCESDRTHNNFQTGVWQQPTGMHWCSLYHSLTPALSRRERGYKRHSAEGNASAPPGWLLAWVLA